jgi:hypothetical protein
VYAKVFIWESSLNDLRSRDEHRHDPAPSYCLQLALTSVLALSLRNTTTFAQHTIVGSHRVVDQVLLQYFRYDPIISFQLDNHVSMIPIIASESGPSFGGSVKFDPEGWRIPPVAHGHHRAPSKIK